MVSPAWYRPGRRVPTLVAMIAVVWQAYAAERSWAEIPDPKLKYEAFWAARPEQDQATLALFQFDDKADASVAIEELEETLKKPAVGGPPVAGGGLDGPGAAAKPVSSMALTGDAVLCKVGRWGGGVTLSGAGGVKVASLDLRPYIATDNAATIDLWIKPGGKQRGDDSVLLWLGGVGGASAMTVTRSAAGDVRLVSGEMVLLAHPRRAPSEQWTHVSLLIRKPGGGPTLMLGVNGEPAWLCSAEDVASKSPAFASFLGGEVFVGCGASNQRGLIGDIDAFRASRGRRNFYPMFDPALPDPNAGRKLVESPPYFVREKPPVVRLSFDGDLKPAEPFAGVDFKGNAKPDDYAEGVRGKALSLRRARDIGLSVAGRNVLPADKGTLEFWFRPLDWDNFFVGDFLGTNIRWTTLFYFGPAGQGPDHAARALNICLGRTSQMAGAEFVQIHPGAWTHVLCTWGPGGEAVYLNGKPQPLPQVSFGARKPGYDAFRKWIESGANDAAMGFQFVTHNTLIDEFRILDRPLSDLEAMNAYLRYLPSGESAMRKLDPVRTRFDYFAYAPHLKGTVWCLPVNGVDPAMARVTVTLPDGQPVGPVAEVKLNADGVGMFGFNQTLGFGDHAVSVEVIGPDGKTLVTRQAVYERPKPVWWQNKLGLDRVVPRPWTPIVVNEGTAKVWGREVQIEGSGLPVRISAAGSELFAGSPRLHGMSGGAEFKLESVGAKPNFTQTAADLVEWKGAMTSASINAEIVGSLEYDGLLALDVAISPRSGEAKVDKFYVDFPLKQGSASQLIANGGGGNFRASYDVRMVPQGTGRVWDSKTSKPGMNRGVAVGSFLPMIWLGDDTRGLCFFGENDQGWTPTNDLPSQEILREGDAVVYRMNVVSQPITLNGPRRFRFFLHPTPTKPLPANWRGFNRGRPGEAMSSYDAIDDFVGFPMTEPYGRLPTAIGFALEPASWDDAAKWRGDLVAKFGAANPAFKYVDASWPRFGPSMADYKYELWTMGRLAWTREVEDYYVWIMNEWMRRGLIDGIYVDDVSFGANRLTYNTAYKLPDGTVQPGFNTLGLRRVFKRLWTLFDQAGRQPHFVAHMTWCFEIPALSFFEGALNGEDRVIPPNAEHTFIDAWGRDEIRVMSPGAKFGFVGLWIPEIKTEGMEKSLNAWTYRQSRAMHALAVPHDLWYLFTFPTAHVLAEAMAKFGIGDPQTRFVAYYETASPVKVAAPRGGPNEGRFLASAWVRGKTALVMVGNLTKKEETVTLEIDPTGVWPSAARFAVRDVDPMPDPPKANAASKSELRAAKDQMLKSSIDLDTKSGGLDGFALEDEDEKRKEKARPVVEGNRVSIMVRGADYRLLEISPE